jgi:hypothetical protein
MVRQTLSIHALLYRLKAKLDAKSLAEADIALTGWDRSDYSQPN